MPREKRNLIVCLLLALLTLALYNPVNRHPFVNYDDDRYVTENPHVRQGLTADTIRWALTSTEQANWHPLTWMSHALDVTLFHLNPAGHHFTSVLVHSVNVALLFLLLIWGTGRFAPSLFIAFLFAMHPVQVESVAWVAERKNLLCTTFFFLTLLAYGWYSQKANWKRYLAVLTLFAAGLASKPMVITLPFVLLLMDYWPLGRHDTTSPPVTWSRLIAEKGPLFALSGASAVITVYAQQAGGAVRSTAQLSFGVRLENAIYSYAMYLWKMVWPLGLAPLYPHPGTSLAAWKVFAASLLLVAISVVVFKFRRRRYLLVGWLWFLGILVPVIGLVQVGEAARADRYAYIPLIGVFGMIAFGIDELAQKKRLPPPAIPAVAVAVALLLAVLTFRQIGYWQSSVDLWTYTLAATQNNYVAEDNLGGALLLEGKEDEALPHFKAAARINPRDPMSRLNLGAYLQTHQQVADAIAQYNSVIHLTGDKTLLTQAYANLGAAYRTLGDDGQAKASFLQSLRMNPEQFNAWLGLGVIARNEEKLSEAIADFTNSVNIRPTAEGFLQLGHTLAQAGHIAEARHAYEQALALSPGLAEAQQALTTLQQAQR